MAQKTDSKHDPRRVPRSGTLKKRTKPDPVCARTFDGNAPDKDIRAPRKVQPPLALSSIDHNSAPDFSTLRLPRVRRHHCTAPDGKHAGPLAQLQLRWGDDVLTCTRVFYQNYGRFYFFASQTEFGDDVPFAAARGFLRDGSSPVFPVVPDAKLFYERNDITRYALFYYHMPRRAELWKNSDTPLVGTTSEPLCIGFDCEWTNGDGETRDVVSRQYAFRVAGAAFAGIAVLAPNQPRGHRGLLGQDLGCIISELVRCNVPMYLPVAHGHFDPEINITLATHTASVDLSCLDDSKSIMKTCVPLAGHGLLGRDVYRTEYTPESWTSDDRGLHVVRKRGNNTQRKRRNVCKVTVRDTLGLAPGKKRKLKDLGDLCGTRKIELPDGVIEHMDKLLDENTQLYLDYAMTDSFVVVDYLAKMFGHNVQYPGTLGSVVAHYGRDKLAEHYEAKHQNTLDAKYLGSMRLTVDGVQSFVPTSAAAGAAHSLAVSSYMGGRNESFSIGPRTAGPYYDVDLKNAYPAALASFRDVRWDAPGGCCITIMNERMTDWLCAPHEVGFGVVDFEFPADCAYPCIPVRDASGRGLVYPLTGTDVPATLPEIQVALKAGAEVFAKTFVFLRQQKNSFPFRPMLRTMVAERAKYAESDGADSLGASLFKELSCMVYGKTAQGIRSVFRFDPASLGMTRVPFSPLTNPVVASHTTGLVRAAVSALMLQLHAMGKSIESVTTDGLITDATETEIASCDLFGLRERFECARRHIAPHDFDAGVWSVKHQMDWFVNVKTRGNIAPNRNGVLARAGVKLTREEKKTLDEDPESCRADLIHRYMTRNGPIVCSWEALPSLREYFEKKADGIPKSVTRGLSWEYDLKRRPSDVADKVLSFNGDLLVHAVATTRPWRNIAEFDSARRAHLRLSRRVPPAADDKCGNTLRVLRSATDFADLEQEMSAGGKGRCSKLESLVRCLLTAYRAGYVTVPEFEGLNGIAICALVKDRTDVVVSSTLWSRLKTRARGVSALALIEPLLGLTSFPVEFHVDVSSDETLSELKDGGAVPHRDNCGDPDTFRERVKEYVDSVPADFFISEASLSYDTVRGRGHGWDPKDPRICPGKPYASKVPARLRDEMREHLERRGWDRQWSQKIEEQDAAAMELSEEIDACLAFQRDSMPDDTGLCADDIAELRRREQEREERRRAWRKKHRELKKLIKEAAEGERIRKAALRRVS